MESEYIVKEGLLMTSWLSIELEQTIHSHGGAPGKTLWAQEENMSTYYDYSTDRQCGVPIKSLAELRKEVGLA